MIRIHELPRHPLRGTARHIHIEDTKMEDWRRDLRRYKAIDCMNLSDRSIAEQAFEENASLLFTGTAEELLLPYRMSNDFVGEWMLNAHGGPMKFPRLVGKKEWGYETGLIQRKRVQEWVDQMDQPGRLLYIAVCNASNSDVTTRHAPILYPDTIHRIHKGRFAANVKVYLPRRGLVAP